MTTTTEKNDIRLFRNFAYQFSRLQKIAKTMHRLDENHCNYGLSKSQETRMKNLMKQAQEIAEIFGFSAFHQGDPRGCSLYMTDDTVTMDNYTDGIPVC